MAHRAIKIHYNNYYFLQKHHAFVTSVWFVNDSVKIFFSIFCFILTHYLFVQKKIMKSICILTFGISCILISLSSAAQSFSCIPVTTTTAASSVGSTSVTIGGQMISEGGSPVLLRGICYSLNPNPGFLDFRTLDGSGLGAFSTILTNLSPNTTYYARSYARNTNGWVSYGNSEFFTTPPILAFGNSCQGTPTVTDVDGNVYLGVQIGTQC